MKIIFLDFDGVMNSRQFIKALYQNSGKTKLIREFCPLASSNLLYILSSVPDAQIVVSSSWRIRESLENLQTYLFEGANIPKERVIDTTCFMPGKERGLEIQEWLDRHPEIEKYVILDDSSDMAHLMPKLVHTSWDLGLMIDKAEEAIKMLDPTTTCMDCGAIGKVAGDYRCNPCIFKRLRESGEIK